MRTLLLACVLLGSCSDAKTSTDPVVAQGTRETDESLANEVLFGLRPAPGREHVIANCLPCHSGAIIASNHLSREGWNEVIDTMQKKNGMHALPPATRTAILDYLEAEQRPADRGLTQGKASPWAAPLYRPNPLWK